jgi:hypothetical protein
MWDTESGKFVVYFGDRNGYVIYKRRVNTDVSRCTLLCRPFTLLFPGQ